MKLKDIYLKIIREGIKADPRKREQVQATLRQSKKTYQAQKANLKKFFDKESLTNPYADTRILCGDPNKDIKRVLIGIDIGVAEILLADRLSQTGEKIDLVLSHHPEGKAWADLPEVMPLQTDVLINLGVNPKVAKDLMRKRIDKVARRVHSSNHSQVGDAARLLNIPLLCCHTPADNHVATYLQKLVNVKKPKKLRHLLDLLLKEPEYRLAAHQSAGPKILSGKSQDEAGPVFVDMTGGTSGAQEVFSRLSQLGIQTVLGMHFSDQHFEKIKSEYINVVIAGHIASDNMGMNLLLDKLEKQKRFSILECSGFRRFRR